MRIRSPSQRRLRRSRIELLEPRLVLDSTVVFNEVLYHAADGDTQEWIELHNQMAVDMDLSGWGLRDAVRFDFPAGTVVPGGGYLVVANDPVALIEATHLTNVLGPWDGRLDNGGERIQLVNNSQRVMDELDYNDRRRGRWAPTAREQLWPSGTPERQRSTRPTGQRASSWVALRASRISPRAWSSGSPPHWCRRARRRSSMCRPVVRWPMPGLSPPMCSEVGAKPGAPLRRAWALSMPRR